MVFKPRGWKVIYQASKQDTGKLTDTSQAEGPLLGHFLRLVLPEYKPCFLKNDGGGQETLKTPFLATALFKRGQRHLNLSPTVISFSPCFLPAHLYLSLQLRPLILSCAPCNLCKLALFPQNILEAHRGLHSPVENVGLTALQSR